MIVFYLLLLPLNAFGTYVSYKQSVRLRDKTSYVLLFLNSLCLGYNLFSLMSTL